MADSTDKDPRWSGTPRDANTKDSPPAEKGSGGKVLDAEKKNTRKK